MIKIVKLASLSRWPLLVLGSLLTTSAIAADISLNEPLDIVNSGFFTAENWTANAFGSVEQRRTIETNSLGDGRKAKATLSVPTSVGRVDLKVKVSAEECCDYLKIFVNGVLTLERRSNGKFESVSILLDPSVENSVDFVYVKDSSGSEGDDRVWLKDFVFRSETSQKAAGTFDGGRLPVGFSDIKGWGPQPYRPGSDYGFGHIKLPDNGVASFQYTIPKGHGALLFDLFTSTEGPDRFWVFDITDKKTVLMTASGKNSRSQRRILLDPTRQTTLLFQYQKDQSRDEGEDRVWLDDFELEAVDGSTISPLEIAFNEDYRHPAVTMESPWQVVDDQKYKVTSIASSLTEFNRTTSILVALPEKFSHVNFRFRLSVENGRDGLRVYPLNEGLRSLVGGDSVFTATETTNGYVDVRLNLTELPKESRYLRFAYFQDSSERRGEDRVLIDQIRFEVDGQ